MLSLNFLKGQVLDGKKVKKLMKNEAEFDAFLDKYFDMLDTDKSGCLTREEMKPALLRFGVLLDLPAPGTKKETDALADKLFTTIMDDDKNAEVDRSRFIAISKEFLKGVSNHLEEKPILVNLYDGTVLQELVENEEIFYQLVDDMFKEFDLDGSGKLSRLELQLALYSVGLIPHPQDSNEADALTSGVIAKYGGSDMEVDRGEFEKILRDAMRDLSEELHKQPLMSALDSAKNLTAAQIRKEASDKSKMARAASGRFREWDMIRRGRLSRSQVALGFKKLCLEYNLPEVPPEELEALYAPVFEKADEDNSGWVEQDEFSNLFPDLLRKVADKVEELAPSITVPSGSSGGVLGWLAGLTGSPSKEPLSRTSSAPSTGGSFNSRASRGSSVLSPSPSQSLRDSDSSSSSGARGSPSAAAAAAAAAASTAFGFFAAASPKEAPAAGKPSADEIKAKYGYASKKPGGALGEAAEAREKLRQRGEKIDKLSQAADEMDADAAEYQELTAALAKKMEKKWWLFSTVESPREIRDLSGIASDAIFVCI